MNKVYTALFFVLTLLMGCGDEEMASQIDDPVDNAEQITAGAMVYMEPQPTGNTFACVHCHAIAEPSVDNFVRPGHPIGDALRRETFKNGQLTDFLDAANSCLDEWMAVDAPWTESTAELLALNAYLDSEDVGSGSAEPIQTILATPITYAEDEVLTGDVDEGQAVFNQSCAICHGQDAIGTLQAPALTSGLSDPNYIANRVRLSGSTESVVYDGLTGGRMPFWAEDRLTDSELNDIIAFLIASNAIDEPEQPTVDEMPVEEVSDCGVTHPSIGQTAELITRFHDVAGTATIIDDCTVEITQFDFDGGGIDVRVYGALGGNYDSGFILGENLVRTTEYNNETIRVTLPEGVSFDDMDSLSIWCVPVGVSFGDGLFN